MKIRHNILKVFTGLSFGLGIISSGSAYAATVTYDFTVKNLDGSLAGNTYSGYVEYDDSIAANQITGNGSEYITSRKGGLKFYFNFLGNTFKEIHDESKRTQLGFKNGIVDSLYFRIDSNEYDYSRIGYLFNFIGYSTDEFGKTSQVDFSYTIDGINGSSGNGDVVFSRRASTPIPESNSLIGIGAIAATALMMKSKKA